MNKLNEIQQKLSVPKSQYNKFANFYYRNCEDIVEAVKPLLDTATLVLSDEMVMLGDRFYIKATVTLTHEKELWIATGFAREVETKKGMDGSQITGSSSSYARKYALNGLFAIDDTKDADSKDNNGKPEQKTQSKVQPKATPVQQNPHDKEIVLTLDEKKVQAYQILKTKTLREQVYNTWDINIKNAGETNIDNIIKTINMLKNKE